MREKQYPEDFWTQKNWRFRIETPLFVYNYHCCWCHKISLLYF